MTANYRRVNDRRGDADGGPIKLSKQFATATHPGRLCATRLATRRHAWIGVGVMVLGQPLEISMRTRYLCFAWMLLVTMHGGAAFGEVSVARGLKISIIGGCHDCHTEGYSESEGKIDSEKALKGSSIGRQGPWGTTYPGNLRLDASDLSEDGFVRIFQTLKASPPMPWYNLRAMDEDDIRSLYQYIRSLGEPGVLAPSFVPPGEKVKTRYIVLAPPQMPPACTRDLDCGVGEVCGKSEPRMCIPK